MGYSSLVSHVDISPNKTVGRTYNGKKWAIDMVSIHCMAAQLSVEVCGEVFHNRQASSNYGIGPDGRIAVYVDENDRSWCTSSAANDVRAITIEVASDKEHPYAVKEAAYNSLIKLLVDVCKRHKIPKLLWKGDKSFWGQINMQNMSVHRWFSNKACPGDWLYSRHSEIASKVNQLLGNPDILQTITIDSDTVGSSDATGSSDDLEINVGQTEGNSNLVTYVNRLSCGKHNVRESRITRITVHISRKIGDIHDLSEMLNSSDKAYNYGIDNDGVIGLFVDETEWTVSSNSKANDKLAVNIICMNEKLAPNYEISNDCMKSLRKLCEDICRRNFIFKLEYTGHSDVDTLTMHKDFNPLSECPGPYLEKKLISLAKKVTEKIGAEIKPNQVIMKARLATSETEALKAQSTISIKSIKPYVIAPSPSILNVDYASLKDLGVVGAMLDAGARYDKNHSLIRYRSEKIYRQTAEVQGAGLFHSYIYTTRARTTKEVREEAYWFYYVVSKYPPKLGVWLRCEFDVSNDKAEKLVQDWYYFFVDWGLKSKCGLRCTKKQAEKIGWPKQCEYMPLWLEGELPENVCPDDEILTPSFFKMNDLTNQGYNINTATIESLPDIVDYNNYTVSTPELTDDGGVSIPSNWNGIKLTRTLGTIQGPSGKETYYDLDMYGVVQIMKRDLKLNANYWEREDGCKMYGSYIMVAADLSLRPRGTIIATSLGMAMVCDTGTFALSNNTQLDIATNWTKGAHYWEKKEGRTIQ